MLPFGVIAKESRLGGPTASCTVIEIDSKFAVIVVLPWLTPSASPVPLIVATDVLTADQLTNPLTFCVLPSL